MTNDKQRERLAELLSKFNIICRQDCRGLEKSCTQCNREQLADYLLANGVIVPPCGKTVQDGIGFKGEKCKCGQILKWT
jgi:hypothetical protein